MKEEKYINPKIRPSEQEMMDRLMTIIDRIEKTDDDGIYPNASNFLNGLKRIALYGEK